ncbi:MAG: iron ABC transporter permease [Spirochaetia bacterium]|nr:iron ABC transporter permease [Spirochaetia bacterium]
MTILKYNMVLFGLLMLLTLSAAASLSVGAHRISVEEMLRVLMPVSAEDETNRSILLDIRAPRVILAIMVGGSLAIGGAILQGLFRNPIVDPGFIGLSSGASLAASLYIVFSAHVPFFANLFGAHALPVAAFSGAITACIIVARIGSVRGKTTITVLLLAGVAITALAEAGTGILSFLATDAQLRSLTFWRLGSLGGATWVLLGSVFAFFILPVLFLPYLSRGLDLFALGEREAGHLGLRTELFKNLAMAVTCLLVGAAVSASGTISFVGLVVPHILRLAFHPSHRFLLPASGLLGGSLMLLADLAARTIAAPTEVPIGILTALLGAPFFLWLFRRQRAEGFTA